MNCKQNELAIVVRDLGQGLHLLGRICTTLHLAPRIPFTLPDGYGSHGTINATPSWVVEFANPINAPTGNNGVVTGSRATRYAVVADSFLRPIRGSEEPEADSTNTNTPTEATA